MSKNMDQSPVSNPGMSPAVQEAMQRRGMGALNQTSPGAAMANPVDQPSNPSDATKSSAPPTPGQSGTDKWQPGNQQDFIVAALAEQLKNSHKLQMEQTKTVPVPTPQSMLNPMPSPQVSPSQGGPYAGGMGGVAPLPQPQGM